MPKLTMELHPHEFGDRIPSLGPNSIGFSPSRIAISADELAREVIRRLQPRMVRRLDREVVRRRLDREVVRRLDRGVVRRFEREVAELEREVVRRDSIAGRSNAAFRSGWSRKLAIT